MHFGSLGHHFGTLGHPGGGSSSKETLGRGVGFQLIEDTLRVFLTIWVHIGAFLLCSFADIFLKIFWLESQLVV